MCNVRNEMIAELGGEMLFSRRIGFSGTPSDLLPLELGKCEYERCSDGQMIHVLCSPEVCSVEVVDEGWTPLSLLRHIATGRAMQQQDEQDKGDGQCQRAPTADACRFHALIDTGALITGMSNLQVARALLNLGLDWCEVSGISQLLSVMQIDRSLTAHYHALFIHTSRA
jgi:hypothetical protein